MPKPPSDRHPAAPPRRRPGAPIDPESLPYQWLRVSLTLCLYTLAALACCHLILGTISGASSPGPP